MPILHFLPCFFVKMFLPYYTTWFSTNGSGKNKFLDPSTLSLPLVENSIFFHTAWKIKKFSLTQILREVNVKCSEFLLFSKGWNLSKNQNSGTPKLQKMAFFEPLRSLNLISRNIWVTEKSRNFNSVKCKQQKFRQFHEHSVEISEIFYHPDFTWNKF